MMDRKFWHGVVKALDKEMHLEHKPHGTLQFPVLPKINYASFANLTQGELDTIEPIPYSLLTVDWAKNSAYYKYMIRFTYPKWEHGKYYAIHISGEAVESPYFAKFLMDEINTAGIVELTDQEKHHKLLYEKQKEWIEKKQKEGWGSVNFQEAYEYFSDEKFLHKLNELKMEPVPSAMEQKLIEKALAKQKWLEDHTPVPQWGDSGQKLSQVIPGLSHVVMDGCPTGCGSMVGAKLEEVIIHLNDRHKWPRCADDPDPGGAKRNIADWVEEYAIEMHLDMTFHTIRSEDEVPF